MVGWVGDSIDDAHLALCADADFAGCVDSLRSTSGGHLNIQGPNTRFPLSGSSKRQGCVSHSTPEAEIVAADVAMSLKLLQRILKKSPDIYTKAFNDGRKWPSLLSDPDTLKALTPSCDPIKGTMQTASQRRIA